MAGSRQYRRDSRGRFAGAGPGTKVTTGRSGGFASAAHRANVANLRASRRQSALLRRAVLRAGAGVLGSAVVGAAIGAGVEYGFGRIGIPSNVTLGKKPQIENMKKTGARKFMSKGPA